jgi:hypothetical protein
MTPNSQHHHNHQHQQVPPIFRHFASDMEEAGLTHWLLEFASHRASFLKDFKRVDFENVTVIELKGLLRRYGIARAGKKVELEERVKQVAEFLEQQIAKEEAIRLGEDIDSVVRPGTKDGSSSTAIDEAAMCDASIYINA